jgi:hypothetical protein
MTTKSGIQLACELVKVLDGVPIDLATNAHPLWFWNGSATKGSFVPSKIVSLMRGT